MTKNLFGNDKNKVAEYMLYEENKNKLIFRNFSFVDWREKDRLYSGKQNRPKFINELVNGCIRAQRIIWEEGNNIAYCITLVDCCICALIPQ